MSTDKVPDSEVTHAEQEPPQSTSVSSPFLIPSEQVALVVKSESKVTASSSEVHDAEIRSNNR